MEKVEGKGKEKGNGGRGGRGGERLKRRETEKGAKRPSYCVQVYNTTEGERAGNERTGKHYNLLPRDSASRVT